MDQRVSMIMTGAQDIAKLRAFYEQGLGWTPWMPNSASYKVGHSVVIFLPAFGVIVGYLVRAFREAD